MIIKTVDFVKKFMSDIHMILVYTKGFFEIKKKFFEKVQYISKKDGMPYEAVMNQELDNRNNFKNTSNKSKSLPVFNFVGSFATKDFGKILSDIDLNQKPNLTSPGVLIRIKDIIDKTNPSTKSANMPFSFIRFYLGTIKGYEPPWIYDQFGNCEFNLSGIPGWLEKIKLIVPDDILNSINEILFKDSISLRDLVKINDIMKKYTSITWINEDIQRGYKIVLGIKYDLDYLLINTKSKIVAKFIYKYDNTNGLDIYNLAQDYLLVDLSLNQTTGDLISLEYYYLDDTSYKFKSLKRYLPADLVKTYREEFGDSAGYLTTIGTRLDLLEKIERYNTNEKIMPFIEFNNLRKNLDYFAENQGYAKYNPDFKQQSIKEMDKNVQDLIKNIREGLFRIYKEKIVNKKDEFYYYILRGQEANLQISKFLINQRLSNGIKCPFFFLQGQDLKILINLSLKFKFDPIKFVYCINNLANITGFDSSDIFNQINYESFSLIENENGLFDFYENKLLLASNNVENFNEILLSMNLKITFKNRNYSLYEGDTLLITEKIIKNINDFLKQKNLYIKYSHFSINRYELFDWNSSSILNISIEQAQKLLIIRILN